MADEETVAKGQSGGIGWIWILVAVGAAFAAGKFLGGPGGAGKISEVEQAPSLPPPPLEPGQSSNRSNSPPLLSARASNAVSALTSVSNQTPALTSVSSVVSSPPSVGETTYNGIVLPRVWPPAFGYRMDREIMDVPYLRIAPDPIDISIGRQLFVDNFLIESITNLTRHYPRAEIHTNSPVLLPEMKWEGKSAMPVHDGIVWDPTNYHFKMWYQAGESNLSALAISTNGVDWNKPVLHRKSGSNLVQPYSRGMCTVLLDHDEKDRSRRFKMFRTAEQAGITGLALHASGDGTNWGPVLRWFVPAPEPSTVFYNPFRKVWSFVLEDPMQQGIKHYWEMRDLMKGRIWNRIEETPLWLGTDKYDAGHPELKQLPRIKHVSVTPYESLLVGVFTISKGQFPPGSGSPEPTEINLGYSRDGFHWLRPDRRPLINLKEQNGDWQWDNIQSVGGGFNIVRRNLNFSFAGDVRKGADGKHVGSMGVAQLRRDGFAAMRAGAEEGVLITKPIKFTYAGYMLVNFKTNAPGGEIRVAVVSTNGNQLEVTNTEDKSVHAFSKDNCVPVSADQTLMSVNWKGIPNMGMLMHRPIRLVFYMKNADLYSFWISRSRRGRSEGYSAGGGLHYSGPTDVIGNRSYNPESYLPKWKRPQPKTNPAPNLVMLPTNKTQSATNQVPKQGKAPVKK